MTVSTVRLWTLCAFSSLVALTIRQASDAGTASPAEFLNSQGSRMILVRAGSFRMGTDRPTDPASLGQSPVFETGDADEKPVHEVRITYDFYLSETEVTAARFAELQEDHQDTGMFSPYATGISWDDAVEYCRWLSAREGKHIACRPKRSGSTRPAQAARGTSLPGICRPAVESRTSGA